MEEIMGKHVGSKRILSAVLVGALAVTLLPAHLHRQEAEAATVASGTYHAALGIQTCTNLWLNRFAYYSNKGSINVMYGTEHANQLYYLNKDAATKKDTPYFYSEGTFTDTEITGNGNYTVSLTGAKFLGDITISQLHIATDIPDNDTIKCSNVVVTINGKETVKLETSEVDTDSKRKYLAGGLDFLIMNSWRPDLITTLEKKGLKLSKTNTNGYDLLTGVEDNITINFDISGFTTNQDGTTATPAPSAATSGGSSADGTAATDILPKVGTKVQSGALEYKVTKSDQTKGTAVVSRVSKSKATQKIADTIKIEGTTFKVTGIAASAFAKDKRLTKVTIGKYVTTIGKKAFYKCKKLKNINLKGNTVLSSVGKDAIKGVNRKCTIQADTKQKSAVKKLFKK